MKREHFEDFLLDSFGNGVAVRELRLSHEEVEYIKSSYPMAILKKGAEQDSMDGRIWYEIHLSNIRNHREKPHSVIELTALRQEKEVLVRELADTKKELERLRYELEMLKAGKNK